MGNLRLRKLLLRAWCAVPGVRAMLTPRVTGDLVGNLSRRLRNARLASCRVPTLSAPGTSENLALPYPQVWALPLLVIAARAKTGEVQFASMPPPPIFGKHFGNESSPLPAQGPARTSEPTEELTRVLPTPARAAIPWDTLFLLLQPLETVLRDMVLPAPLYDFQLAGIKFLAETEPGALLGDDMGLGKTVQAIVALRFLIQAGQAKTALVVCPRSLLAQWSRELSQWAPGLRHLVVYGQRGKRQPMWAVNAHVYLTTYDVVTQDIYAISRRASSLPKAVFDVVVLDEISKIKNPRSQRSTAIRRIPRLRAWGLSGTPLENRLDDVLAIFSFLHPQLFADDEELTPADVRSRIQPFFLRRRKEDVLTQLPPIVHREVWLDIGPAQRRSYEMAYETGLIELERGRETITVHHVLALLQKLKQICNVDPASRQSVKIDWLEESLADMTSSGDKAVVFSQFLDSGVDEILDRLNGRFPTLKYVGDMSTTQREQVISRFAADPDYKVLVSTYGAGSFGLNLQAANYVVRFDHWWNPAIERQAVDRTHRIGQTKTVFVYDLWVQDTVEEKIHRILERKRQLFSQVIDSLAVEGGEKTGLTEADLFGLFGLAPPR